MTLTMIGTGFVGVVSSAVFSSFGNTVYGLDVVEEKIEKLKRAEIPFYEPGLKELVEEQIKKGNLHFTTSYQEAISGSDVVILAVGTPSAADGQADLKFVFAACETLAPFLKEGAIVAIKSTVPPGTNAKIEQIIREKTRVKFFTASLPEFLKEGTAVQDTLHPDRILIGATDASVIEKLKTLHAPLGAPVLVMKPESAQMAKYAANAYLATRITFINQIANLCEVNGADVLEVIQAIGQDKRIGSHYWYPGLGYGGSCFPKDVKELAAYAKGIGQNGNLMVKVSELNEERHLALLERYEKQIGGWEGKTVGILGLSFKPNTDDMREAPSTKVIPYLLTKNTHMKAYDPLATKTAQSWFPQWNIEYTQSTQEALKDSDIVMLLIECEEFISLSVSDIATGMKKGGWFIDVRDQFASKRQEFDQYGIHYIGVGIS